MQIRVARIEDAEAACHVLRRSITELCCADHHNDAQTLAHWLSNKTAENVRQWIDQHHVLVATESEAVLGVGAIDSSGKIILNYVSPDARFCGISKALLAGLEARARELAVDMVSLRSTATARSFYLASGYVPDGSEIKVSGMIAGHPMTKRLAPQRGEQMPGERYQPDTDEDLRR